MSPLSIAVSSTDSFLGKVECDKTPLYPHTHIPYDSKKINLCLLISDENRSVSLTLTAAPFVRGRLCAMPIKNSWRRIRLFFCHRLLPRWVKATKYECAKRRAQTVFKKRRKSINVHRPLRWPLLSHRSIPNLSRMPRIWNEQGKQERKCLFPDYWQPYSTGAPRPAERGEKILT